MKRPFLLVLITLALGACAQEEHSVSPDVAVAWNERVLTLAVAEDKLLTLKGVRSAAMMHLAMHDALNAIDRRYRPYAFESDAHGADPVAAAAQAAYEVLVNQYPAAQSELEGELKTWLALAPDEQSRSRAIETGRAAATAVLAKRADDGWNNPATYKLQPMAPGVYAEFPEHSGTPQGFVFGAGWALAKPFALRAADQFRSPPPPAITSAAYTQAFNEVKELGRFESPKRTADQTHLALWWKDFVENSHNRLARALIAQEGTDLWTATRLFALLNMSVMDAYISVFDNKFFYNHWRPYTAIRWAANDGNPDTVPDPDWNNTHRHTYPFPSYPSAHGTACAAAMTVMAETFGDRFAFAMRTDEVDSAGPMSPRLRMEPPTRSFDSFSAAAKECALSRLYLGIHFRYDAEAGNALGRQVGAYVVENSLTSAR
ncbi:MAG TPA: vanadium-dependent haloperoxidase [Steroidobacteraceae bacterium]|nr:vanadium-dependent haloperoxidase [Steroidobacteraceae bacterium]